MFSHFFRWLEKNRASMLANLFVVIVAAWIIEWIIQWFGGTSESYYIFGYNPFSVVINTGSVIFVFFLIVSIFDIRSSAEKISEELESQFSADQEEILRKIVGAKDEELRKDLRHKAFAVRQEYESLLGKNLREKEGIPFRDWREYLLAAHKRLTNEEHRLLLRNRANMRSGIGLALSGAILPAAYLYYLFVIGSGFAGNSLLLHFTNYLPAVSIVLILETVAVFYLRLYSATERRIEKNKNELTNIELRLTAGAMLYENSRKIKFAELAETLSKEERNFVLGKNESSAVLDTNKLLELLSKIPKIGT